MTLSINPHQDKGSSDMCAKLPWMMNGFMSTQSLHATPKRCPSLSTWLTDALTSAIPEPKGPPGSASSHYYLILVMLSETRFSAIHII